MDRQRLTRIFDVIQHLAAHGPCSVTEIATALDAPLSSTHDLLKAMVDTGLVHCTEKNYGIGPRTIRAALSVVDSIAVQRLACRHLEELVETIGFDVYLAMSGGSSVIYVSRFAGRQRVNLDLELGRSLFLHSTSVGKLFAAFDRNVYQAMMAKPRPALTSSTRTSPADLDRDLASIREKRFSVSRGESIQGIVGLATPVFGPDGSLAAAVHVSALRTALSAKQLNAVARQMTATSHAIENDLAEPAASVSA
ncbi:IclR family transcriptional regulator [Streptomyces sp. NPDC058321]|uniref:IclR family transcriptional regulator n=1 Tax=Streptomyces sp. NPDC058321 TaxID=3346445 RepID=UPI0036E25FE1